MPDRESRILCYGDSLTVGLCPNGLVSRETVRFEPYGRALTDKLAAAGIACEVSVCGHSGHTVKQMVANLDKVVGPDCAGQVGKGLGRILDADGHYDLVLIMAGTNDLGLGTPAAEILRDTCRLHAVCHARGVLTVALAAPPSPRAHGGPIAAARQHLASELAGWARSTPMVAAFIDPGDLIPAVARGLWDVDGLHLSNVGSRQLGQLLAPLVEKWLVRSGAPSKEAKATTSSALTLSSMTVPLPSKIASSASKVPSSVTVPMLSRAPPMVRMARVRPATSPAPAPVPRSPRTHAKADVAEWEVPLDLARLRQEAVKRTPSTSVGVNTATSTRVTVIRSLPGGLRCSVGTTRLGSSGPVSELSPGKHWSYEGAPSHAPKLTACAAVAGGWGQVSLGTLQREADFPTVEDTRRPQPTEQVAV